ncbi:Serine/threonine-protein phosphatase 2 [Planctomycetes bacterium CA13]|uniref:Serine/threonine-protein phosphatase 2 n=1 Tax=Novipirellula herctigrandis TaxID=2527986 RepID=A0A5C5Z1F8_9BACT|nr:Serine/threonine-protein phosphatase 2 [Planctomycetes bacterium CA13]
MKRLLAIGDIHGCYDALVTLTDFVSLCDDDTFVTLGDYVDRGPQSRQVLDWLIRLDQTHHLFPLRGNHEVMMAAARNKQADFDRWIAIGGYSTLCSYEDHGEADDETWRQIPESHWKFITDRLLPYYETEHFIFVHASYYADMAMDDQPDYVLYWEKFAYPSRHQSGKVVICGHTSQASGYPRRNENSICIDTRVYGDGKSGDGWLSCLDVDQRIVWQANQKGKTRKFFLEDVC